MNSFRNSSYFEAAHLGQWLHTGFRLNGSRLQDPFVPCEYCGEVTLGKVDAFLSISSFITTNIMNAK
jgi:hypothetical protein